MAGFLAAQSRGFHGGGAGEYAVGCLEIRCKEARRQAVEEVGA